MSDIKEVLEWCVRYVEYMNKMDPARADKNLIAELLLTLSQLEREGEWTKDLPTVDGFYWLRYKEARGMLIDEVGYVTTDNQVITSMRLGDNDYQTFDLAKLYGWQFSGPIQPPRAPTLCKKCTN